MQQKREVKILLSDSFKELVLEKNVEKITIKEITDRAGVIRVTFYNHFQDKYELLEWICQEEIVNPARILLRNNMRKEAIRFVFTALYKNKEFYTRVAQTRGQNSFESTVKQLISETIEEYFAANEFTKHGKYGWLTSGWIADYYATSLTYILKSWIDKDMSVPPEEMADTYEFVATHSLFDIPGEF